MYSIELNITGTWIDYSQYFNGLEEITTSVVREDDAFGNKVLREKADIGKLSISDELYKIICGIANANSCDIINVRIGRICNKNTIYIYEGEIRVNDIIFKPYIGIAEISSLYDNGYSARIDSAKNQKVLLNAIKSRNNEPLVISSQNLIFVDIANVYNQSRIVWDVLDVVRFLVGYATDNTVNVTSAYLTSNKWYITTVGQLLQLSPFTSIGYQYPEVSLSECLTELYKALKLTTKYDAKTKTLFVEPESNFFVNAISAELPIGMDDTVKISTDKNYETVSIGSNTYIQIQTTDRYDSYADSGLLSFKDESVNACGSCNNRDSTFDLINDWIIDTDHIDTCIISPIGIDVEDFGKIVLIHGNGVNAITTPNGADVMYNEIINNYNKAIRHFDTLPSCFTKYYGANGNFKAVNGYDIDYTQGNMGLGVHSVNFWSGTTYGQIDQFDTEIYDEAPSGFDNANGIYNNNSGGVLKKKFQLNVTGRRAGTSGNTADSAVTVKIKIIWYDNTFSIVKGQEVRQIIIPAKNNSLHTISATTECYNMASGDNVVAKLYLYWQDRGKFRFIIPNGKMIFQSLDCETGALGSVVVSGGASSLIYEISNKGVITNEIYDTILSKQDYLIKIADSEWYIKELKYNHLTGEYSFTGLGDSMPCCYN